MTADQIAQLIIGLLSATGIGALIMRWYIGRTPLGKAEVEAVEAKAELEEAQAARVIQETSVSLVKPLSDRLMVVEQELRDYIKQNAELRIQINKQAETMSGMQRKIDALEQENALLEKKIEQYRKRIRELEKG